MLSVEKPTSCPYCGRRNDLVTDIPNDGAIPEDGDISFCFNCGEIGMFEESAKGGMRRLTSEEETDIWTDKEIQRAHAAWKTVREQKERDDADRRD